LGRGTPTASTLPLSALLDDDRVKEEEKIFGDRRAELLIALVAAFKEQKTIQTKVLISSLCRVDFTRPYFVRQTTKGFEMTLW
jgi:hypothetical protein